MLASHDVSASSELDAEVMALFHVENVENIRMCAFAG